VLDRFAIDFSLCMYCGICIEVCPFDALFWAPEFEYAELDIRDLVHEKDRLREWMWTVPAPAPLDVHSEPAKELVAARKAADPAPARSEPPAPPGGGRDRTHNVLDRFAIDWSLCMYCSICIEVCPFDALHWSPELAAPESDIRDLLHERDRLRQRAED
jgi:formate hydrogenlyase subunit 6/NADH:ubiquinone oxidoreductase subunit I